MSVKMKLNTLAIIYQNIIKLYGNYFNLFKLDKNSKSVMVSNLRVRCRDEIF